MKKTIKMEKPPEGRNIEPDVMLWKIPGQELWVAFQDNESCLITIDSATREIIGYLPPDQIRVVMDAFDKLLEAKDGEEPSLVFSVNETHGNN